MYPNINDLRDFKKKLLTKRTYRDSKNEKKNFFIQF